MNNFGAPCSICLLLGLPNRPKTTLVGEVAGRTPVNVTAWEKIGGLLVKTAAHVTTCHLKRKSVLAVSETWVGRVARKLHAARIKSASTLQHRRRPNQAGRRGPNHRLDVIEQVFPSIITSGKQVSLVNLGNVLSVETTDLS
jgi:hypothetical protein